MRGGSLEPNRDVASIYVAGEGMSIHTAPLYSQLDTEYTGTIQIPKSKRYLQPISCLRPLIIPTILLYAPLKRQDLAVSRGSCGVHGGCEERFTTEDD